MSVISGTEEEQGLGSTILLVVITSFGPTTGNPEPTAISRVAMEVHFDRLCHLMGNGLFTEVDIYLRLGCVLGISPMVMNGGWLFQFSVMIKNPGLPVTPIRE